MTPLPLSTSGVPLTRRIAADALIACLATSDRDPSGYLPSLAADQRMQHLRAGAAADQAGVDDDGGRGLHTIGDTL